MVIYKNFRNNKHSNGDISPLEYTKGIFPGQFLLAWMNGRGHPGRPVSELRTIMDVAPVVEKPVNFLKIKSIRKILKTSKSFKFYQIIKQLP